MNKAFLFLAQYEKQFVIIYFKVLIIKRCLTWTNL